MAARKATRRKKAGKAKSTASRNARRGGKKATAKAVSRTRKKSAAKSTGKRKLYTLTEVGRMASVSMPTLQKYKKNYADRIPSVGEGRRQRYPKAAVAVLRQLKKENLAKRGRPPKSASAKKVASGARQQRASGLLTLTEISRRTNISYPTVSRYVKLFLDRIPHEGIGRARRFPKEAVAAFRQLRSESRPGRPKGATAAPSAGKANTAALDARLRRLEKAQADLSKQLASVVKLLKKPVQVTIKRS